ncbi:hypothetical protein Vadar_013559 [Vaccinium darrowii]|uniref:Uncharacterized protein n=1 Tax=Vaccinium darrowii TaxID=229202 RepID=A0ACB7X0C8_9ERIC|nr:hypothetical protein Vadar_013559 [Vaccinium darrowii]
MNLMKMRMRIKVRMGIELRDTSEESTDLEEFVDSEIDESEDDMYYDTNVAATIEWQGLFAAKGKAPVHSQTRKENENDLSYAEAQFDELVSLHGSDEESGPQYSQLNMNVDMADPKFKVGMIFATRNQFKAAVKEHAIRTLKPIKFIKNDSQKVRAVCQGKKCSWVLLGSRMPGSKSFQVKTYVPTHNCERVFHNKHVTAKWVSKKYVETLRSNPSWHVKSFKDQVQQDHKVGVSRAQLYKAQALALEMIEGDMEKQYAKLPDYCEKLRRTNPDTTVILKTIEDDESGGRQRPLQRLMHIVVGVDGNNQSYVVSYALVEAENKSSWKWFMEILVEDLHIGNNFTFISVKQKGLIAAVAEVVPYAEHRFCIRHFYNNFKETNKGLHLKEILFSAAKATYVAQFNFHMQELQEADEEAMTSLNDHPPVH